MMDISAPQPNDPSRLQRLAAVLRSFVARPRYRLAAGALFLLLLLAGYMLTLGAPANYPTGSLVRVAEGETVAEIAQSFKEQGVIRHPALFVAVMRVLGGNRGAIAGSYYLPTRDNVLTIALRVRFGSFELDPVRVTIPEGVSVREIGEILSERLPGFDTRAFLVLAQGREGYLFPDTYFFLPGEEPERVVAAMRGNFDRQLEAIAEELATFGRPLEEVIIMASLLEEEAPYLVDKRTIAGILWKRIEQGIPLQVDAVFPYIIGKNSFTLTREDLENDSPYNTYRYKGLPAGPITNPGLDSILAAVTPTPSDYLFYLSDLGGNFHFSQTYEQHLNFKARYLDNS